MTMHRIACPPALDQDTGRTIRDEAAALTVHEGDTIVLDLAHTEDMDSRGAAWILAIARIAGAAGAELAFDGQHSHAAEFVDLIRPGLAAAATAQPRPKPSFIEHAGDFGINMAREVRDFWDLLIDVLYWTFFAPVEGRGLRFGLLVDELHEMGVRAFRIVVVMNFLLGLTIAMMSAAQLEQLGLDIYVADLVMIGFARELAAIMTAVVVSARTGAAIAAEVATMKVQEEIDALRGMGLNVTQYLVTPKLLALLIMLPILTSFGMIAGVLGGTVWGLYVLDFSFSVWYDETLGAASMDDIMQGLLKSVAFAVVIVLVGCHNGLRVSGGSRGVGLMTTRAVVMDIFLIVFIDMVFAAVFYYVLD